MKKKKTLQRLINEKRWAEVHDRIKLYPKEVVAESSKSSFLPLHDAIRNGAPLNKIVKAIAQTSPHALHQTDKYGRTPLHHWFLSEPEVAEMNVDTLAWLLQYDNNQNGPHCAKVKDKDGNIALHLAVGYGHSMDVVKRLIEVYPDGITEQNLEGTTPPEFATNLNLAVARYFYEKYPETKKLAHARRKCTRIRPRREESVAEKVMKYLPSLGTDNDGTGSGAVCAVAFV
mmetsp:Transcript_14916/g.43449  ORF Transcript_14916/g.43449 Transcript_14916/m.43449 type:complete len:230 (-) Transcript_14916:26-715(-)